MAFKLHSPRLNIILCASGVIFYWILSLVLYKLSAYPLEPGDSIHHYQIARFSWENTDNLLNHWGKPLFTILSSPFAQVGFVGMILFNLVLFSAASFMLYRMAVRFSFALPGLAPFVLMSSMVFFQMVNAGMTEILMASLGVAALYCYSRDRFSWGAFILSFGVVARPEAVVFIPLYALILIFARQWKSIPLLASGFIIFSLLGHWGFGKDWLWLVSEDPYPGVSPYGSGSIFRFVKHPDLIFGYFCTVLFIMAIVLFSTSRISKLRSDRLSQVLLFSILSTLLVLALHTLLWWKGLKGSFGLLRVMATIIPFAGFAAMYAADRFIKKVNLKISVSLVVLLLAFSSLHAVVKSGFPTTSNYELVLQAEAAEWYLQQNHQGKISYLAPYIGFKAGLNPSDHSKVWLLWGLNREDPSATLNDGDILIWDSQLGPREGGIAEEKITDNPNLKLVKSLEAEEEDYRIHIAIVDKQKP